MSYMPPAKSDVHLTPDRVYDLIEYYWGYVREELWDVCPVDSDFNALNGKEWHEINYANPPYTLLSEFVEMAESQAFIYHFTTIMLLPSKTDQHWFHDIILSNKYEIQWIEKRLKFKGEKWGATQPHFLCLIK